MNVQQPIAYASTAGSRVIWRAGAQGLIFVEAPGNGSVNNLFASEVKFPCGKVGPNIWFQSTRKHISLQVMDKLRSDPLFYDTQHAWLTVLGVINVAVDDRPKNCFPLLATSHGCARSSIRCCGSLKGLPYQNTILLTPTLGNLKEYPIRVLFSRWQWVRCGGLTASPFLRWANAGSMR